MYIKSSVIWYSLLSWDTSRIKFTIYDVLVFMKCYFPRTQCEVYEDYWNQMEDIDVFEIWLSLLSLNMLFLLRHLFRVIWAWKNEGKKLLLGATFNCTIHDWKLKGQPKIDAKLWRKKIIVFFFDITHYLLHLFIFWLYGSLVTSELPALLSTSLKKCW